MRSTFIDALMGGLVLSFNDNKTLISTNTVSKALTCRLRALTLTWWSEPEGTRISVKLDSNLGQKSGPGLSLAPFTCKPKVKKRHLKHSDSSITPN